MLRSYFRWIGHLKQGKADAKAILLMDEFFRALRSDFGQSSARLEKGAFVHLILRNGDFFLEQARQNPHITLAEVGQWEEKRFGPDSGSPTKVK